MQIYSVSLLLGSSVALSVNAFAPHVVPQTRTVPIYASTKPSQNENIVVDTLEAVDATVKGAISGMALAAALWVAPATIAGPVISHFPGNNVIASSVASAKEMASGSGTRVNKDPESLLRYGLPINNKEVRLDGGIILWRMIYVTTFAQLTSCHILIHIIVYYNCRSGNCKRVLKIFVLTSNQSVNQLHSMI